MSDCALSHSDAAYVLGSLSPTDRLEFERHLPGCESCRRSVAELAGLPGLLARVPVEQVEAPVPFEPLPATVLPALVAVVRREQRRKTVLVMLGAAAAIAVVALGVGALQAARDDGRVPEAAPTSASPTVAPAQPMDVVHDYGMRADVSLTPVGWGTKVLLTCSYPEPDGDYGDGHAYEYRLVAFTGDGKSDKVMTWTAVPGKTMSLPGSTAAVLDDITHVEVQSEHGRTILRLDL
jgi:Putative zinc-finger